MFDLHREGWLLPPSFVGGLVTLFGIKRKKVWVFLAGLVSSLFCSRAFFFFWEFFDLVFFFLVFLLCLDAFFSFVNLYT